MRHTHALTLILLLGAFALASIAGARSARIVEIPLLDNHFVVTGYGNTDSPRFIFIAPHFNEQIGTREARKLVEGWKNPQEAALYVVGSRNADLTARMKECGVEKNDPPERYLYFSYDIHWYCIDPNRIFSRRGFERELILWENRAWHVAKELKREVKIPVMVDSDVPDAVRGLLKAVGIEREGKSPEAVVAVHNNTPTPAGSLDTFSILWYKEGGPASGDVAHKGPEHCVFEGDPSHIDDLILVTEPGDYAYIRKDGRFNVALLKNNPESDDGSLSTYCLRKGIRYINIEAQHMNSQPRQNEKNGEYQYSMLQLVKKMLKEKKR